MPAELQASRRDATLILTLSNPGAKNALHPDLCAAAIEVLSTAERDDSVRAVVLTGADGYFCAGSSFNQLLDNRAKDRAIEAEFIDNLQGWIEAIQDCPKPVIAAVEGGAAGAGFSLALACDMIVASASAKFAMPNVSVALAPEGGAAWLLSRALPRQLMAEALFTGEALVATRLHELGVVNRIVAEGMALDAALDWSDRLAAQAPNVMEQIKTLTSRSFHQTLDQHFSEEKLAFIESLYHANGYEGIRAFFEQRKPLYK